uniref:hypothetical protein n=1 Tax=Ideonella sp. TaxID=1929293 RepID=UPI0037BF9A80
MKCLHQVGGRLAALWIGVSALLFGAVGAVQAQQPAVASKLAPDLRPYAANSSALPEVTWAKQLHSGMHVKVLIVASGTDASLADLRSDIVAKGGSVFYNYVSVRALSALLPSAALNSVAARADVLSISPNRATARHASLLQASTGSGDELR